MDFVLVIGLIVLQLSSLGALEALVKFEVITSVQCFLAVKAGGILLTLLLVYLLFRRGYRNVDPIMYIFCLQISSSLHHFVGALELVGYIPENINPIVYKLMPSAKAAIAQTSAILWWDGVVNLILAVTCIALYTHRVSHREVSLYWTGSVLNGITLFITVLLSGKSEVDAMTFRPEIIISVYVPLLSLIYLIHNRPIQARSFIKFAPILKRPIDLLFFVYFLFALKISVVRGLAVSGVKISFVKDYIQSVEPYLTDASGVPKFQMMLYEFVFGIYYIFAMYGLWNPGQHWMSDFSLVHAGAAGQAQFTHIAGAFSSHTPKALRPASAKSGAGILFLAINILMMVVPQLFAFWTSRDYEMFGRTQTVDYCDTIRKYSRVVKRVQVETVVEKKQD